MSERIQPASPGFLYNDAYSDILGAKHPSALGRRFHEIWTEIWDDLLPLIEEAMSGQATWAENLPLTMKRNGFEELTYFTFSYSPVRDDAGDVGGMFCACTEPTAKVMAEEALRASEARASGVLEGMGEGFALLDRDFRILQMNAEAVRLEGRPASELLGRSHWEVDPGVETRASLQRVHRLDDRSHVCGMRRYEPTDGQWEQIAPLLLPQKPRTGRLAEDHRQVLNGMLWVLRTGAPWADLPARYGPVGTVSSRFYRWRQAGVFDRVLRRLQAKADARGARDWDLHFVDATMVRAHQHAAGARPSGAIGG